MVYHCEIIVRDTRWKTGDTFQVYIIFILTVPIWYKYVQGNQVVSSTQYNKATLLIT